MVGNTLVRKVSEASQPAKQIATDLTSTDATTQYTALKSLTQYKNKDFILDSHIFEQVTFCLEPINPMHLRLQALLVIGCLSDANFADRVCPLIHDGNLTVAKQAIATLIQLEAHRCGHHILDLLRDPEQSQLHRACLKFLERISLRDDADAFSAIYLLEEWQRQQPTEVGTDLRAVKVLRRQWSSYRDDIFKRLLKYLDLESSEVRRTVIEGIYNTAVDEDLWIRDRTTNAQLQTALQTIFANGTRSEVAMAQAIALTWDEFPNKQVWQSISQSTAADIHALLYELEVASFRIKDVFDEPEDVDAITQRLSKVETSLYPPLLKILAKIPSTEALLVLVQRNYKPQKEEAVSLLESLAKTETWHPEFDTLLTQSLQTVTKTKWSTAMSLLAKFKADRISLAEMIASFPRKNLAGRWADNVYEIEAILEEIGAAHDSEQHEALALSDLIEAVYEDRGKGRR